MKKFDTDKIFSYFGRRDTKKETSYNMTIIASLIRKKRIEKRMTLKETAESICSISYLSKIESNKIIPNDFCLRKLMENLGISNEDIILLENSKELVFKSLNAFLLMDKELFDSINYLVEGAEGNAVADLIKSGYYLFNKRYDEAKNLLSSLINQAPALNEDLLGILSYYICEYLLGVKRFIDLERGIRSLDSVNFEKKYDCLIDDVKFRSYVALNKPVLALEVYYKLVKIYSERNLTNRYEQIKKEYMKLLFENNEYLELTNEEFLNINQIYASNDDEIKSYIGISFYKIKKQIQAKEFLDNIDFSSNVFPKIVEYRYNLVNDRESFKRTVKNINEQKKNFYLTYFLEKIEGEISPALFSSNEFEKEYASSDCYGRIMLLNLKKEYLYEKYKYKEAANISKKIEKMRESINDNGEIF